MSEIFSTILGFKDKYFSEIKFDKNEVMKAMPNIFKYYYLLSNYRTKFTHSDLTIRTLAGETQSGKEIPFYLINTLASINSLEITGHKGTYKLRGGDTEYNQLDIVIPKQINLRARGCAAPIDTFGDFHWETSDSSSQLYSSFDGGIFGLNTILKPAIDDGSFGHSRVFNVIGAIIFGPDLVGIRRSEGVDETTGCLIVKLT